MKRHYNQFLILILIVSVIFQSIAAPLAEILNRPSPEVVISEKAEGTSDSDENKDITQTSLSNTSKEQNNSGSSYEKEEYSDDYQADPSYTISFENRVSTYKSPNRSISNGDTFTDEYGAEYTIRSYVSNNITYLEAHLTSVPAGITSYTVPTYITVNGNTNINVTEVKGNALTGATNLTDLSFESPENISLLVDSLRGPVLEKVNEGKVIVDAGNNNPLLSDGSKIYASMFASVALDVGFPIASGELPALKKSLQGEDTFMNASVLLKKRQPAAGETSYELLTGESAVFIIVMSNSGINSSKTVRVYFEYDRNNDTIGEGPNLGRFPVGEYELQSGANNLTYPFRVKKAENAPEGKEIYYYEIQGAQGEGSASETIAFESGISFPSRSSAGGNLKVWTEIVDSPTEPLHTNPTDWMSINWNTFQSDFKITKSLATYKGNSSIPALVSGSDGTVYLNNLQYAISLSKLPETNATTNGRDHVTVVHYEDTLSLPKGVHLPEEIINAIRDGKYSFNTTASRYGSASSSTYTSYLLRTTTSPAKEVLYIHQPQESYSEIQNRQAEIVIDDDGRETIKIS